MPSSATSRASIPTGVPAKSRSVIVKRLERAAQISAISSVRSAAARGVAAEERGHRGRGGERHPAEPDALDHRRVADVERRVLGRVAVAQQRVLHRRGRRREPAAGQPGDLQIPRRCRCATSATRRSSPRPARPRSAAHLAAAIVRLRKKWWLRDMKRAAGSSPSAASAGARSRSSRLPVAWLRMCSSSPMLRPCAARPNTSTGPRALEQPRQRRPEPVAEEAQPLDRLVVADAEPQRPARAPRSASSRRARAAVLDDPHRHRRRADAGHRPDVAVVVARLQRDLAALAAAARPRRGPAPSPRTPRRRAAPGAAGRTRAPTRSAAPSAAAARRAARARPCPPAPPSPPAALRPRCARRTPRWRPATRSPCAPHSRVSAARIAASPPAGGRQSTSTTGAPWSRSASAKVDEADVDGLDAWERGQARARSRWLNGADGGPGRAGRGGPIGAGPARQARREADRAPRRRHRRRRRRARAPSRRRTSSSAARRCRRRSSPPTRSAPAPRRSSRTSPTSARWAGARSRSSTCW